MYICICNGITDKQIRDAAKAGVTNLSGLQQELGVAAGCGTCGDAAAEILAEHRQHKAEPVRPMVYRPALA